MACNCNQQENALLSWVVGNDVLLLARVYEKVLNDGEVTDLPFDLSACDDIEVSLSTVYSSVTLPREAWEIKEDEDNCIAMLIPHELTQGTWAVEITCKRNGYHVRSFEFTFKVVETNCEAQMTFEVVDGCQSASVRVALQIVPQALVRGQNSYEAWKELPGNEGKSLQEYIDEVLDMNGVMARLAEAEQERVQAEEARAEAEQRRADSEVERTAAEGGRAEAEVERSNAERLRAANETNRQENEAGRREAERSRAESEAQRAAAESAREQAEQNRETAEQNREQATATALQTVAAATSAANDAASAATEATEGAENVDAQFSTDGGAVLLTVINRRGVANTKEVGFRIFRTYETVAAMNADAANVEEGRFVMIAGDVEQTDTGKLYVKGATGFTFLTDLSGAQGIKGDPFTYADFTPEQIAELQRPATEAAALAERKATEAGRVNATLNGTELIVTDRNGNSVTQDVQGQKGDPGTTDYNELENKPVIPVIPDNTAYLGDSDGSGTVPDNLVIVEAKDWPLTNGDKGTIYRVQGTTSYTDFAWDGMKFVPMATYDNLIDDEPTAGSNNLVKSGGVYRELALGAVYDVSAHNGNAAFASLSALLSDVNLSTLIPLAVRKGGMSIKFIQSSGNKYIQARCMAQNFTTDVTQWQGVDEELAFRSKNLIESGEAYERISPIEGVNGCVVSSWVDGYYINGVTLQKVESQYYHYSTPIHVSAGDLITVNTAGGNIGVICKSDSSGNILSALVASPNGGSAVIKTLYSYSVIEDCYIVICCKYSIAGSFACINNLSAKLQERLSGMDSFTWVNNKLISASNLKEQSANGYRYSSPIKVSKGDLITINTAGPNFAIICKSDSSGNLTSALLVASTSASATNNFLYSYTIEEDSYIVICYKYSIAGSYYNINGLQSTFESYDNKLLPLNGFSGCTIKKWINNYYVDLLLKLVPDQGYCYSEPIQVFAGDLITVNTAGPNFAIICKSDSSGNLISVLANAKGDALSSVNELYRHTIEENCYIVICYKYSITGSYYSINGISDVADIVLGKRTSSWIYGYLILSANMQKQSAKDYCYSKPIQVKTGDLVTINTAGGSIGVICKSDDSGTLLSVLVSAPSTASVTENSLYKYEMKEDCYIVICYKYSIAGSYYDINGVRSLIAMQGERNGNFYGGIYVYPFRTISRTNVWLFKDTLFTGLKPIENYEVFIPNSDVSFAKNKTKRAILFNASAGTHTLHLKVRNVHNEVEFAKDVMVTVRNVPQSKLSQKSRLNVFFFGDSIVAYNYNKIGEEFRRYLSTDDGGRTNQDGSIEPAAINICSGKINLIGEIDSGGVNYQYSSTIANILTGKRDVDYGASGVIPSYFASHNPFYNPYSTQPDEVGEDGFNKRVDFEWYFSHACPEGEFPNLIYMSIGVNDIGTGDNYWSGDSVDITSDRIIAVCKKMKSAIDNMAGGNSGVKIKIFNHQSYPLQFASYNNLPIEQARCIQNLYYNSVYEKIIANSLSGYVELLDCASKFDIENGYSIGYVSSNSRTTEVNDVGLTSGDGVHMNNVGAYLYADCLIRDFLADTTFD